MFFILKPTWKSFKLPSQTSSIQMYVLCWGVIRRHRSEQVGAVFLSLPPLPPRGRNPATLTLLSSFLFPQRKTARHRDFHPSRRAAPFRTNWKFSGRIFGGKLPASAIYVWFSTKRVTNVPPKYKAARKNIHFLQFCVLLFKIVAQMRKIAADTSLFSTSSPAISIPKRWIVWGKFQKCLFFRSTLAQKTSL